MGSRDRFPGNRSIGSCRGAQPHDGTCSSAVRPYCLRSKTWGSLRLHVHLCNNAHLSGKNRECTQKPESLTEARHRCCADTSAHAQ
ncbi:MAG: hypothetical protein VB125_05315 [Burkholderia sp.]